MKKVILFIFIFLAFMINVKADDEFITDIKMDGSSIEGFSSDKTDYEIKVDSSKDKINLVYFYNTSKYQGVGSVGELSLKYGDNNLEYTLTDKENAEITKTYKIKVIRPDNRSSDNSLSSLTVGNNKVVLSDANEYTVSVDGKTTSVEITGTLANDKASFIDGYGERTGGNAVSLTNESTTVEIRVKAENESVRTYTIRINKTNVLSNDATLKSLTVEGIDFDFKSNTLEYKLSVKYNVSKVKINAVKNNEKANVEYTPNVTLKSGENTFDVKVTAEDGTVKVYKLTITREEEVPIVKDIKITGIDFEFKPKTYNYKIETTLSSLDFNVTLSNETAKSEITNNENLKNGSVIKLVATDGEESVTYSFQIINKEVVEEKEDDAVTTGVKSTNNLNKFLKENEMLMGLVIFGVGIFGTLISILMKRKDTVVEK